MSNVKTINLTGGETEINFDQKFMCFWVQNLGSGDVYASVKPGAVPEADGVIAVGAGASARVFPADMSRIDTLYLTGSGKVQIVGSYSEYCPFKTEAKGGDPSGGSKLTVFGDAAYFDASSIDIKNKVWNNILDPEKQALLQSASEVSVLIEENEVIFPVNDYAVYDTETLSTIYAVYKLVEHDGDVVIGKGTKSDIRGTGFDIWSANDGTNISVLTNTFNLNSGVDPFDRFHVVCITRKVINAQLLRAELYVDGEYYGMTSGDMTDVNYTGSFYINTVFRVGKKYADGHNAFKAIVFDTFPHPENVILANMEYLKNKYL